MPLHCAVISLDTKGYSDVIDITGFVSEIVSESEISNGIVAVFIPGSTASVTTIEYESGAVEDLKNAIEKIVPQSANYSHDARWGDGNGFSHVRAALIGASISIPLINGTLSLGTWQQIICVDFDNKPRKRKVVVQVFGE